MKTEIYNQHAATLQRVAALCGAKILPLLPEVWSPQVLIARANRAAVLVDTCYQHKEKLSFSPVFLRHWEPQRDGYDIATRYNSRVYMNPSRSEKSLAADLARRGVWTAAEQLGRDDIAAQEKRNKETAALEMRVHDLKSIFQTTHGGNAGRYYFPGGDIDLTPYSFTDSTSLRIAIHHWPAVLQILRIMHEDQNMKTHKQSA